MRDALFCVSPLLELCVCVCGFNCIYREGRREEEEEKKNESIKCEIN